MAKKPTVKVKDVPTKKNPKGGMNKKEGIAS